MDWLIAAGLPQNDAFRASLGCIAALQVAVWVLFIFWPKAASVRSQ
jgi:hypothetical protein